MPGQFENTSIPEKSVDAIFTRNGSFMTTHWSVVVQAGQSGSVEAQNALEKLCCSYWYPLYVHTRRLGWSEQDAKDLIQQFFARLLERNYLQRVDQKRGRFRSFLLTSLKHFLADEWERLHTQKRGGGLQIISWDDFNPEERYVHEPMERMTPDRIYEKRWAGILLERVLDGLKVEYQKAGRSEEYAQLKSFVWGDGNPGTYFEAAAHLGMEENALKVAVHRLRKRFREQLRQEVGRTVSAPEEIDEELLYLRSLLS